MYKLTFFPLGNADSCRIDLTNGKKILFDFGAEGSPSDKNDKRIDLPKVLREDLKAAKKSSFEIVAITHLDNDHTQGADEFFHLDYSPSYQGGDRIKIDTLWVPANVITESRNGLEPGSKALQAEARYRLENGYGIRVFSRPGKLEDWLKKKGLTLKSREHLITDAGQLAPELSLALDGVEFFVHAPFAWRQNESEVVDRNGDSLLMQATFQVESQLTKVLLGSDVYHEALCEIVKTTKRHKRETKLEWDVMKLFHHCSYTALGLDRGKDKTMPVAEVKWLFEQQGRYRATIISTSWPIPQKYSDEDESPQPPHRQAANYYREDVLKPKNGEFLVTMETPSIEKPRPIEIEISNLGAKVIKAQSSGIPAIISSVAPRAG
jgi:beta-lactamase superfamily II metal-dependent hydrolase